MTTGVDWASLPARRVPVAWLVWPCHDIDPAHTHPAPGQPVEDGPLHCERLTSGHLFVHDGRHRAIRAQLAGEPTILARVHRDRDAVRGEHGPELVNVPAGTVYRHRSA